MRNRVFNFLTTAFLVGVFSANLTAQISDFSEDFEGVDAMSETAISDLGYIVFGMFLIQSLNSATATVRNPPRIRQPMVSTTRFQGSSKRLARELIR